MIGNNDSTLKIGADVKDAIAGINRVTDALPGLAQATVAGFSIAAVTQYVKASIDAADAMGKMAQKTGISTDVLSGYSRAAALSDVSSEALARSLQSLARNMGAGSAEFEKYGIATTDANGKLLATDKVFEQIADKMQQMPDGTEKAAMAMALLGKTGADLVPMLNEGSIGLDVMREKARAAGETIGGPFAEDAQRFNDNLTEMGLRARGAGNDIAAYLLPSLNGLIEFFNKKPADRLAEIKKELLELRQQDDYTGFVDVRIAKLEQEEAVLKKINKLEQARAALAGAGKLGDIRDARDRIGEAGQQSGAIAKYEAGRKPGKAAKVERGAHEDNEAGIYDGAGSYEMGSAYGEDPARGALLARLAQRVSDIQTGFLSEQEVESQNHLARIDAIGAMQTEVQEATFATYEDRIAAEQYYNDLTEQEQSRHDQRMIELALDQKSKSEAFANAMVQVEIMKFGGMQQAAAQGYQLMSLMGLKHTALAKSLFVAGKAAAVAQIYLQAQVASATVTASGLSAASITAAAIVAASLGTVPYSAAYAPLAAEALAQGEAVRTIGMVNAGLAAAIGIAESASVIRGGSAASIGGGGGGAGSISGGSGVTAPTAYGGVVPPAPDVLGQAAAPERIINLNFAGAGQMFDQKFIVDTLLPGLETALDNGAGNTRFIVTQG